MKIGEGLARPASASPVSNVVSRKRPEIAIVGGGLAGLVAARRLLSSGVVVTLFEASERLGGRVDTGRNAFSNGQIVERGGELVSEDHTSLLSILRELEIETDDLYTAARNGLDSDGWYVLGRRYLRDEAEADFEPVAAALASDLEAAPWPTRFDSCGAGARGLDGMSVHAWIESRVPGGLASPLGRLVDVAQRVEFGADTQEQSALNVVYALGSLPPGSFSPFGATRERYRIRGGADGLISKLSERVADDVRLGHRLVTAASDGDGHVRLTLAAPDGLHNVRVSRAVVAVPFSALRSVDLANIELSNVKRRAIAELGMGSHVKMHLQFRKRHWEAAGFTGDTLTDMRYQCTWDESLAHSGASGILVNYRGGRTAASAISAAPEDAARDFLGQLERVFPGISGYWNREVVIDRWGPESAPGGSYSYYRVGQYTTFSGAEMLPEGRMHFAGEHTCAEFQGYMEGAVRSGERAALEVLDADG